MGAAASCGCLWRAASRRCFARREDSSLRSVPLTCCGRAGGGVRAGGWCGVEGAWDECGLLPALQPRVPTRLSRCGFVVGDIPAVRCGVQRRQRMGGAKGGCVLLRPAGCFVCGRSLVCADAWEKHPPWLLLVVAVAVCSRCTVLPSPVPCVCARELLLLGLA
ncbi:chitin-binding like protein, partial [Trypanosoma cruzi]